MNGRKKERKKDRKITQENEFTDIIRKNSRKFFYWRIHRRVLEERIIKHVLEINSSLQRKEIYSMLHELLPQINWQNNQVSIILFFRNISNNNEIFINNFKINSFRMSQKC